MAHSLSYSIPLPWRDHLDLSGAYVRQKPNLGPYFGQVGESGQASVRYGHPLPSLSWLGSEVQAGLDYKTSNNNLDFGGTQVYASSTDVDQFVLTYKGTETDAFGQLVINNDFVFSPGGLTSNNSTTAFLQSGITNASSDYYYNRIELTRFTPLPLWEMNWVARVMGQLSSGNLLSSEQLGAGGANSVRGYNERAAGGSQGYIVSQELRSPAFSLSQLFLQKDWGDKAQMAAFWDYGHVSDNTAIPNTASSTDLQSLGTGFRYTYDPNFSLRADYGYQLDKLPTSNTNGQFVHVAISVAY